MIQRSNRRLPLAACGNCIQPAAAQPSLGRAIAQVRQRTAFLRGGFQLCSTLNCPPGARTYCVSNGPHRGYRSVCLTPQQVCEGFLSMLPAQARCRCLPNGRMDCGKTQGCLGPPVARPPAPPCPPGFKLTPDGRCCPAGGGDVHTLSGLGYKWHELRRLGRLGRSCDACLGLPNDDPCWDTCTQPRTDVEIANNAGRIAAISAIQNDPRVAAVSAYALPMPVYAASQPPPSILDSVGQWFGQSTLIPGVKNSLIAGAGAFLLAIAAISKSGKGRR